MFYFAFLYPSERDRQLLPSTVGINYCRGFYNINIMFYILHLNNINIAFSLLHFCMQVKRTDDYFEFSRRKIFPRNVEECFDVLHTLFIYNLYYSIKIYDSIKTNYIYKRDYYYKIFLTSLYIFCILIYYYQLHNISFCTSVHSSICLHNNWFFSIHIATM